MADDADDEFARFERELRALEAAAPADDEAPADEALRPVIAPAPPPASRAAPAVRAVAATIARPAVAPAPGPASLPPPPPPPPPNAMLAGFYSSHGGAPYGGMPPPYGYQQQGPHGYPPPYAPPPGYPPPFRPPHMAPSVVTGAPPVLVPGVGGYGGGGAAPGSAMAQAQATAAPGSKVVHVRTSAGEKWVDATLAEWPENDHRIFVGDLGKEVSDDVLTRAFMKFPGFLKAKVVKNSSKGETKGFGFASFATLADMVRAIKEQDGKYIGNRPCKLKKSTWQSRDAGVTVLPPTKRLKTKAKDLTHASHRKHLPSAGDH